MGLFSSLFGASKKEVTTTQAEPVLTKPISEMNFDQIFGYLKSCQGSIPSDAINDIHRRLNEIVLYDHHVEQQTRVAAWKLLESLTKDIKISRADNPEYLRILDEAGELMRNHARYTGVGSLGWLIEEHAVPPAEVIPFVMRQEHSHLLADFLTAVGPDTVSEVKKDLVKHLILSRRYGKCTNAVLTLHGLATKGDKATTALFSEGELAVIVGVPDDYIAARQILVNLGLLPAQSSALPFVQVNDESHFTQLMVEVYKHRNEVADGDPRMESIGDDRRELIHGALAIQRLHLIRRMVGQIHGPATSQALLEVLSKGLARDTAVQFDDILSTLENAEAGIPIDFMLIGQFMTMDGISIVTEEDFEREKPWMEFAANWLNVERIEVLDYTRYLLRWDPDNAPPQAKSDSDVSISEFIIQTYMKQGSKAGLAEKMIPYLEDWIGVGD